MERSMFKSVDYNIVAWLLAVAIMVTLVWIFMPDLFVLMGVMIID